MKGMRVNEGIKRVERVRLVGDDGTQVGIMRFDEALQRAKREGLDLVEVAPEASPPVCKIMDYGKYRYELEKKFKKQRRGAKRVKVKEIQLRPKTEEHDYQHKKKRLIRFLQGGNKAKLTIRFRGREMQHVELGREILDRLCEELQEYGEVQVEPKLEGYRMSMIMGPKRVLPGASKPRGDNAKAQDAPGSSETISKDQDGQAQEDEPE